MRYLNPFNVAQSFALWYRAGRTDALLGWDSLPPHPVARVGYALGRSITIKFHALARR